MRCFASNVAVLLLAMMAASTNAFGIEPRDKLRPGEDNGPYPNKVDLTYRFKDKVSKNENRGRLTTFLDGDYPPFEIIHTKSEIDWNHKQRYWGGSFNSSNENGGADGRWLLSKTNGTINAGFNGAKFGASPRVKLVQTIDGSITFVINGNGADLDCKKKRGDKWVCKGRASAPA